MACFSGVLDLYMYVGIFAKYCTHVLDYREVKKLCYLSLQYLAGYIYIATNLHHYGHWGVIPTKGGGVTSALGVSDLGVTSRL